MRWYLLFFLFSSVLPATANHFPGGTLSYRCVGSGLYEFTLLVWRDCSGNAMISQTLNFVSDCGLSFNIGGLLPASVAQVSPLCEAQVTSSTCEGGTLPGVEAYTYVTTQFLSPCAGWTVSWNICCRESSINASGTSGLYIETRLNTVAAPCHDSPRYSSDRVPFVCVGQAVSHDAGVVPGSGSMRRHRFIEARFATPLPFPVVYIPPHYFGEPWTGMAIDSLTGRVTFTPTEIGRIIVAVQVDEYNADGTWIGSVMLDHVFVVTACDNTVPSVSGGTISSLNGTATLLGPRELRACSNGTLCFEALFSDPDASQDVIISSNAASVLPGSTVEASIGNPALVTLCWDATGAAPGIRSFTITAMDNACPVVATQVYTYLVEVVDAPIAGGSGTALLCTLSPPVVLVDSLLAPADGGAWTDPSGSVHSGILQPDTDPPGIYTYAVWSFPGCIGSASVLVEYLPVDDPVCVLLGMDELVTHRPGPYPNPTSGMIWLQGRYAVAGKVLSLELVDGLGRSVALVLPEGSAELLRFDIPLAVPSGSYHMRVHHADGSVLTGPLLLMR